MPARSYDQKLTTSTLRLLILDDGRSLNLSYRPFTVASAPVIGVAVPDPPSSNSSSTSPAAAFAAELFFFFFFFEADETGGGLVKIS
jgi:hypothetical protein